MKILNKKKKKKSVTPRFYNFFTFFTDTRTHTKTDIQVKSKKTQEILFEKKSNPNPHFFFQSIVQATKNPNSNFSVFDEI